MVVTLWSAVLGDEQSFTMFAVMAACWIGGFPEIVWRLLKEPSLKEWPEVFGIMYVES